jgi:hypothetical protein
MAMNECPLFPPGHPRVVEVPDPREARPTVYDRHRPLSQGINEPDHSQSRSRTLTTLKVGPGYCPLSESVQDTDHSQSGPGY